MNRSRLVCALAAGLSSLLAAVHGEPSYPGPDKINSVSGQFIVSVIPENSPFYRRPDVSTNTSILRLDAPLLAVSAERFKASLWRSLGLSENSSWSGKIFLVLHSARSIDEDVVIASQPFIQSWNYRLELPDLVTRNRYARAFSAVLLLEMANRNAPVSGNSAAIPQWLADGLARQIIEADGTKVILSVPAKTVDGLAQTRFNETQRGIDPLADARHVLQNSPALTYDQLTWPNEAQLNGNDGGVYLASAQLFVSDLLVLNNGPAKMRELLAQLPACQNWQTAFLNAFRENFRSLLDVEKWWALRVVSFAARAPGPQWTPAVSRDRLNSILAVPVGIRSAPDALPVRTEISLQAALQNFEPASQVEILQNKLRDLELVQLRLTPALAGVADAYRRSLTDFLTQQKKRTSLQQKKNAAAALIKKLDVLDKRRREAEDQLERQAINVPGQ